MPESQNLQIQAYNVSPGRGLRSCLTFPRKIWSVKNFFLVSCVGFTIYLFLVQFEIEQEQLAIPEEDDNDCLDNEATISLPKDSKYILLWSWRHGVFSPFYLRGEGQETFLALGCSVTTCFVTTNRRLFGRHITKFHALLFHGHLLNSSDLPKARAHHQNYIFYTMESAHNYPICDKVFDGFFNWTSTFRLDSDIPYPYILIRDHNGKIVGPQQKMQWKKKVTAVDDEVIRRIETKNRAAAWFVSNCGGRSRRHELVAKLQNALTPFGFTVDIFGGCGTYQCPRDNQSLCNDILKGTYYFYMSLENSFDVDYVTEKLLLALQNDVVPIVYGAADYKRFLPPGSYIDATKHSISELAAKMNKLINSPQEYSQYFWWQKYYSYHDPKSVENVCAICEALHNEKMLNTTKIYSDFRKWWNPAKERCIVKSNKYYYDDN